MIIFSNRVSFYLNSLDQTQNIRAKSKEYTFTNYQKKLNNFQDVINEDNINWAQKRGKEMFT